LAQNLIMQQKLGAKKVAWMVLNAASAKAYYDSVIKPIAQKLNLTVDPYYYESTTDWATLAATVLSTNPDGIDFPSAEESVCLAAIPAFRNAGFTKTLHASECSNYVDQLPLNQVEGIVNDNLLYFETFTSIPPKVQHDFDIFNRYMARDVPKLTSQVYGEFGFHIAVQVADMLRQIQGDITPQTVAQTMPKTKGPMFFRDTGYDCSQNYWPPDSSACSSNMIYTRTNKDRKKELLDINPIDASAVRPKA
jgi:branched-chain amino acid transport system substrate-binding protein